MCVIAIAVKERLPLEVLRACELANPHGGGMAWVEMGKVHFKKNINAQQAFAIAQTKSLPHVFHFRIASVGNVMPALCHPFPIRSKNNVELEGNTAAALFHNGTVQDWRLYAKLARVNYPSFSSDSLVMSRIVSVCGKSILESIGSGKFCILNSDRTINLYGEFRSHEGGLFSNLFWTYRTMAAQQAAHRRLQAGQGDLEADEDDDDNCDCSPQGNGLRHQAELELERELQREQARDDFYSAYVSTPAQRAAGLSLKVKPQVVNGVVFTPGDNQNAQD